MTTITSGEATAHAGGHGDHSGHGGEHPSFLAHHFETPKQQFEAGKLGMWMFLVQEVLFFSGLFVAYAVYRANHPEVFQYAHHFLDTQLGALNTVVLITSSFTAAWAVRCAQTNNKNGTVALLAITVVLAGVFMVVKYIEYSHKFHSGLLWGQNFNPEVAGHGVAADVVGAVAENPKNVHIFFGIYFAMTALHGLHVLIGIGLMVWMMLRAARGEFSSDYFGPMEYTGLYWHLVDLVWIYLFPLLYLIH